MRETIASAGAESAPAPADAVLEALADALVAATEAKRFDVVAQLARELEARRAAAAEPQILLRIAASSREWAVRYSTLAIPEGHPLAVNLRAWIRPYNDALRDAQRAMVDLAEAFERRVAEERAETAEANAWAARQPPRDRSPS